MTDPCKHCAHVDSCGGSAACLWCRWSLGDRFTPVADCATCRFDPRQHWICSRCVDNDQWTDGKANTCTLCRGARYVDGVGGANGRHPCPRCTPVALCKQCAAECDRSAEWDTFHYGTNRRCDACDREGLCAMMPAAQEVRP